ncbi:MAG: fatty acid desaturase [Campylobacterota bacterium]
MEHTYTPYDEIDQDELQKDIDAIKETIGAPNEEDFEHLLMLERWGRNATYVGFAIVLALGVSSFMGYYLPTAGYWFFAIIAAVFIGLANTSRWANVTHPILHGAYDKVPDVPFRYTKAGYARGARRYVDWLDWIKPEAWEYEHNIMHHYHLGEDDDPDNVENNTQWLHAMKIPVFLKYIGVVILAAMWKISYYAPNTLKILENKERRKKKQPELDSYQWDIFSDNGFLLWKDFILPYGIVKFILIPLLFLPLGSEAFVTAFIIMLMAEVVANLHSFLVIVPNHSADDIYRFNEPHKSQGEFYLRQIMGSVNYCTGSDLIDAAQGFLNYQVEHHLFPNLPLSQYQKMQPIVKELCTKYNIEYRQENVFKRVMMTADLMVGKTKNLRVDGV